jgi:peptidyl-prolyl cis-trans isomerase NIMA-interacting 1
LESHLARIQSGSISLGELAASESDCNSARRHGDLGYFGKGEMQPEFETAAFKLQVGELSPIVSTQSGLHIIERVA